MTLSFLLGEHIIETKDQQEMVGILGRNDEFLRIIQGLYPDTTMVARGTKVVFSGEDRDVEELEQLFGELLFLYRQGLPLTTHDVRYSIYMVKNKSLDRLHDMYADTIIVTHHGRRVNPRRWVNGIMCRISGRTLSLLVSDLPVPVKLTWR